MFCMFVLLPVYIVLALMFLEQAGCYFIDIEQLHVYTQYWADGSDNVN